MADNKVNKKGFVGDFAVLGVTLFVVAIGLFSVFGAFNDSYDKLINNTVVNSSPSAVSAFEGGQNTLNRFDYIIFAVFIGLVFGLFITAWFVGGEPLYMFIYFIVIVIMVVLSVIFATFWEDIVIMSVFNGDLASFPITNNILVNLPLYIGIVGLLGVIAMFVKPYTVGE